MKAPGTLDAVRDIFQLYGLRGLYLGFRLHFGMTSSRFNPLGAAHIQVSQYETPWGLACISLSMTVCAT